VIAHALAVKAPASAKKPKSMVSEAKKVALAVELIQLGARLQLLEHETPMSYEKLLALYKEVAGKSPSKGQLPFSVDYFMTWSENIHASLFANIHTYLTKAADMDDAQALIKSYRLYLIQVKTCGMEAKLSITRAWRLVKFLENDMIQTTPCTKCGGSFLTHPYEIAKHHVCGLCNPPARAGKTLAQTMKEAVMA
jgi:flagellar transcriptional activator FlhC